MKNSFHIQNKNEKINFGFLSEIIRNEFIDSCERIIIDSQPKFINDFYDRIVLLLKNYYSFNIFHESKELNSLLYQNKIEFVTNIYSPMYKSCSEAINLYNNSKSDNNKEYQNISYLLNYRPHCMLSEINQKDSINEIGMHICGGRFIIVQEKDINTKYNSYVICSKCKKCYIDECFPMMCTNCNALYYSEVIQDKRKKENCYLATWYKYHCKNINNEKMSCIKCGEDFWIKNNKLFCKSCKFETNPINIIWTCLICNADFNSEAKVYNRYEFKLAKIILKEALIYKKIVKPGELPCKCVENKIKIKELNFFHKIKNNLNNKECKGVLHICEVNEKKYLVCSKCYNIFSVNKFKWICPICLKSFFSSKIIILAPKNYNHKSNITNFKQLRAYSKTKTSNNSPKKKERTISILDSDTSYNKNANSKGLLYPNQNITKTKNVKPISPFYSSSPSNNNRKINKRIYNLSNRSNNKEEELCKKINKNCFSSFGLRKRRNYSVLPTEIKNEEYLSSFRDGKSGNKHIRSTGSTIFSSLSNYNTINRKENYLNINSNLINDNKVVGQNNNKNLTPNYRYNKTEKNNNDNEIKYFHYKNLKNIFINNNSANSKDNENNEFNYKINNSIISQKFHNINKKRKRNLENKNFIINSQESINQNSLFKHKKDNKSFYIKTKQKLFLSPETSLYYITKEDIINTFRKRKNLKHKNNLTINNSQIGLKQNIHNISKIVPKNKIIMSKGKKDLLNSTTNNKRIIKNSIINNINKNNFKFNYFNDLTINNLSKPNIKITHNNSKKKKNNTSEKIKKVKVKNITITIDNPRIINNINYNLSLSNSNQNIQLYKNNKIRLNYNTNETEKNITNYFIPKKEINKPNSSKNKKELKKFDINDYTIITQLGQGSFGKIYLARDSQKNIYSIKKILLSEELDVKTVLAEYNMCYNLTHENIIKIMGIYSNKLDKTTYVVYVLMEVGISDWDKEINSLKSKKYHYTESDLFNILKQLVSACCFLQKNNISHRDIKPQNILVFKNKIYKITDFGEAKKIEQWEKSNKSFIQYSLKGTELYMSPILFNGLRSGQIDVNHNVYKSDVYSLGLCMLYAATCCEKPLFEIRRIIEMEKVKSYINSQLSENYSEKLINIIISMLEIHEQNRPDFIELDKLLAK